METHIATCFPSQGTRAKGTPPPARLSRVQVVLLGAERRQPAAPCRLPLLGSAPGPQTHFGDVTILNT